MKPTHPLAIRIARYVDACAPAISGCDGHGQAFAVARALVNGFALGEEEAFGWMLYYNHKCEPPWSKAELRHKVRDALNPKTISNNSFTSHRTRTEHQ
jgi:hypothetical protein